MRPRTLSLLFGNALSLYDLSPLRARLVDFIDFERLNRGEVRFSVTTTDVEQGEPVVFDTARGDTIGPDHLIASCGFLPEFPPVEIGGRLLGDGGLSANAPLEAVLEDDRLRGQEILCFAIDLFAAEGRRPTTLAGAAARSLDLFFGAQTVRTLRALGKNVVSVRYHVRPDDPGPHRLFDFSTAALADRWAAGRADMANAVDARRRLAFA
jgi:NTE family protein